MNKINSRTKAEKYNERLHDICNPEIERLRRREDISKEILKILNDRMNIDYCGLEEWVIINIIGKVIDKFIL